MLILLSPSKTVDVTSGLPAHEPSMPRHLEYSYEIAPMLTSLTVDDIMTHMKVSREIAETNYERFQVLAQSLTPPTARPAVFTYSGDVYSGLDAAATFTPAVAAVAQSRLRILSALYGVLRPMDVIAPYRLEMASRLLTPAGQDLYSYWSPVIREALQRDAAEAPGTPCIVNLASTEYSKAAKLRFLGTPVIEPVFKDQARDGSYKVISYHAKIARGSMAQWIVVKGVDDPADFHCFAEGGYEYVPHESSPARPTFRRDRLN